MPCRVMPWRTINTIKYNQQKSQKKRFKFYGREKRDRKVNACSWQEQIIENHLSFYLDNLLHAHHSSCCFFCFCSHFSTFYRGLYFSHSICWTQYIDNSHVMMNFKRTHTNDLHFTSVQMMTLFTQKLT